MKRIIASIITNDRILSTAEKKAIITKRSEYVLPQMIPALFSESYRKYRSAAHAHSEQYGDDECHQRICGSHRCQSVLHPRKRPTMSVSTTLYKLLQHDCRISWGAQTTSMPFVTEPLVRSSCISNSLSLKYILSAHDLTRSNRKRAPILKQ